VSLTRPLHICLIAFSRHGISVKKVRQDLTVMDLAAGDDKAPGTTVFIDYGVNLACAAAA